MANTPGLPSVVDDLDLLEAGVARQLRHVLGAVAGVEVLGGDRRQRDPVLQPLDGCIVLRDYLLPDRIETGRRGERGSAAKKGDRRSVQGYACAAALKGMSWIHPALLGNCLATTQAILT